MAAFFNSLAAGVVTTATIIGSLAVLEKFFNKVISKWLFREMNMRFDQLELKVDVNEKDRLKTEIIDYANDLRNGEKKTDVQYKNLCDAEQKYHKLRGNTYAEYELKYIHETHKKIQVN